MGKQQKPVRLKKPLSRSLRAQESREKAEDAVNSIFAKEPLPSAEGAEENKETIEEKADPSAADDASSSTKGTKSTTNSYIALPTVYALLSLYSLPMLAFLYYLVTVHGGDAPIDFEDSIPRIVVALNIDAVGTGTTENNNLLNDLHKIILPLITFISGIVVVTTSQRRVHYWLVAFVFSLLAISVVTYLLYLPLEYNFLKQLSAADPANTAATGREEYSSISFLFSRSFETLISYLTLLLGLSIVTKQEAEDGTDSAIGKTKKSSLDPDEIKEPTPGGK